MEQHSMLIRTLKDRLKRQSFISAGLDYPGVSPLHCFLKDAKRARYTAASDEDALNAYKMVTKLENLDHHLNQVMLFQLLLKKPKNLIKIQYIIVNSCGDAHKDKNILKRKIRQIIC